MTPSSLLPPQVYATELEKVKVHAQFNDFCATFNLSRGKADDDEDSTVAGEFKVTGVFGCFWRMIICKNFKFRIFNRRIHFNFCFYRNEFILLHTTNQIVSTLNHHPTTHHTITPLHIFTSTTTHHHKIPPPHHTTSHHTTTSHHHTTGHLLRVPSSSRQPGSDASTDPQEPAFLGTHRVHCEGLLHQSLRPAVQWSQWTG